MAQTSTTSAPVPVRDTQLPGASQEQLARTMGVAGNRDVGSPLPEYQRKKIDLELFTFSIPAELKQREATGIDSSIWRYADNKLELLIDMGIYSAKPTTMRAEPEYREERIRIDGKKATLVFFRSSDPQPNRPYVAAAYFPIIDRAHSKLAFYAICASPQQQQRAREIFLSVDFKENSPTLDDRTGAKVFAAGSMGPRRPNAMNGPESRPHIFVSYEREGRVEPLYVGESDRRVWLRFHNNTKWQVMFCSGPVDREYGETEVDYEIERYEGSGETPGTRRSDNCWYRVVASGKSVLFSVPREHLAEGLAIKILFRYKWEDNPDGSDNLLEPKHFVYFYSEDIPKK